MVQTGQTAQKHRSDRSVRSVPILVVNTSTAVDSPTISTPDSTRSAFIPSLFFSCADLLTVTGSSLFSGGNVLFFYSLTFSWGNLKPFRGFLYPPSMLLIHFSFSTNFGSSWTCLPYVKSFKILQFHNLLGDSCNLCSSEAQILQHKHVTNVILHMFLFQTLPTLKI